MRRVDRVLDGLNDVHPAATGVVMSAIDEGAVIDSGDAGDRVRNLFARLLRGSATPVIHEDLPMHLLYGEALGRHAGGHGVAVGHVGRSSVARELPAVKGTLDAILAHAAAREVRAQVRAERRHREYVVRGLAAPDDQCAAQALQVAHFPAPQRLRAEQPVPAVGIGMGIVGKTQIVGVLRLSALRAASREAHRPPTRSPSVRRTRDWPENSSPREPSPGRASRYT